MCNDHRQLKGLLIVIHHDGQMDTPPNECSTTANNLYQTSEMGSFLHCIDRSSVLYHSDPAILPLPHHRFPVAKCYKTSVCCSGNSRRVQELQGTAATLCLNEEAL